MIIWNGLGFFIFVITFVASLIMELTVEASFHDDNYYQAHGWPLAIALLVSAGAVWFVGKRINSNPGRVVIDKDTGREMILGGPDGHRFFFIPMQYWALILGTFALISLGNR